MAFIFTYPNIVRQLQNYCDRTDTKFIETIPTFMTLALDRLTKDVKTILSQIYVESTFVAGQNRIRKPALWRQTVSWNVGSDLNFNTRKQVLQRPYEAIIGDYPDATVMGRPLFYCDDKGYDFWYVAPTPDQAYPYEVAYNQGIPFLDDTQTVNYLTQYAPQVLYYAVLLEAYFYLGNEARYAFVEDKYSKALIALFSEDQNRINDRYTDRSKD